MDNDDSTVSGNTYNRHEIAEKIRSGELVFRKKEGKSRLWDVFAKLEDRYGVELSGYVCCQVCRSVFKYTKISLSSNLVKHKCYTSKFAPSIAESSVSIIEIETPKLESSSSCSETEFLANPSLTELITKCLVKNCRSYALMQDDGLKAVFQEFLTFGAKFGTNIDMDKLLPTSLAVARNVAEIYEQCLQRVKTEIATFTERGFGLATAVWSDVFEKKSLIALTIHFLKNGSLTFRLLGLRSIDGLNCSSQNHKEQVEEILKKFECKIFNQSILITNGEGADSLKAFPHNQNLPCISLLLKNAVQNSVTAVSEVTELFNNCLKLTSFLKNSELNSILTRSLESNCPTRWNTTYKMLLSIENMWNEITTTLQNSNEAERTKIINITLLKAVANTIQPFEEAIECLEEHNAPTLHLVYVYLHELKKSCDRDTNDMDLIRNLKQKLRFNLESIVKHNITILHKLALFLYPPTNKLLQFSAGEKKSIEDECIRLMKCLNNETNNVFNQEIRIESKRNKVLSDFVATEAFHEPHELITRELQFYKSTHVVNTEDFDVFRWWEMQKYNVPLLYRLSSNVFATPASCASVQRVFSSADSLLHEKFSALDLNVCEIEKKSFVKFNTEPHEFDSEL